MIDSQAFDLEMKNPWDPAVNINIAAVAMMKTKVDTVCLLVVR